MEHANLTKLRQLTEKLPMFPVKLNEKEDFREFEMDCGSCFSWELYTNRGKVGVHRWFNSSGSIFPEHVHKELEFIIVYFGEMKLILDEEDPIILSVGDSITIDIDKKHRAEFLTDTSYITVMIPQSKDYD